MASRRAIQVLLIALIFAWPMTISSATTPAVGKASAFIEKLGNEAMEALARTGVNRKLREQHFQRLLDKGFAIKGIAKFVLGRYWRTADKSQRQRYLAVFEQLIVKSYTLRFEKYAGESFRVRSERVDGKSGRLVETIITRRDGPPVKVQWRVRKGETAFKIVDVIIEGVSMVITQRSEFGAVIQSNGGGLDGLIDELQRKVDAFD